MPEDTSGAQDATNESPAQDNAEVANTKVVPESDLIALKRKHEKELATVRSELDEYKAKADSNYEQTLQEQVAREKQATELEAIQKERDQLRESNTTTSAQMEELNKRYTDLESQLLDNTKQSLSREYGVDMEKLEGKSLADLKVLEEAAKLVGTRKASNYDTGSNTTVPSETLTARQKIKAGLVEGR